MTLVFRYDCTLFRRTKLCSAVVGLNCNLDGLRVCSYNLADRGRVLEEVESRHGADAQLLRNIGNLVDIQLVELNVGILFRKSEIEESANAK